MSKTRNNSHSLIERNRIALAYLALARDRFFQKMAEGEKNRIIKEVIAIGDDAAKWVAAEYGTNDPRRIAAKMGVKVFGEEKKSSRRSEYRREKREIVISRKFHEKLLREVQSKELSDRLLKLVVAHELFHHLEAERFGEVFRRYKFIAFQLGPLVKYKYVKGLSEVAAQAFTQSLLELEISPQVFDYLVLANNLL